MSFSGSNKGSSSEPSSSQVSVTSASNPQPKPTSSIQIVYPGDPSESSDSSDEFESGTSSSDDDEVLELQQGVHDDYVEIPKSKGEPIITTDIIPLPKEKLQAFKTLYEKQPLKVKKAMRLHFYKGKPVVNPPPLSRFVQKIKEYQQNIKQERKLALKKRMALFYPNLSKTKGKEAFEKVGRKPPKPATVSNVELHETDTQLIHVDFPARVLNPQKAVSAMGGVEGVNKAFSNLNKKLPVVFRPEDLYCNAAYGEPHPTVGILLRVRRRKPSKKAPKDLPSNPEVIDLVEDNDEDGFPRDANGAVIGDVIINGVPMTREDILREDRKLLKQEMQHRTLDMKKWGKKGPDPEDFYIKIPKNHQPEEDKKLKIEAVGIICRSYKFDGIGDFQYLPTTKKHGNILSTRDKLFPLFGKSADESTEFRGEDLLSNKIEVKDFIVPSRMSRLDKPDSIVEMYQDCDKVKLVPKLQNDQKRNVISTQRAKRNVYTRTHNFLTDTRKKAVPSTPLPEATSDMEKRKLQGDEIGSLKKAFETRPIWSKSALESETRLSSYNLKYLLPCVAYFASNGPWRSLWIRLGFDPREDPSTFLYQTVDYRVQFRFKQYLEELDREKDSAYIFRPNQFPPKAQMFYQLCDLKCEEVERLIDICTDKMGKYELTYNNRFGWLKEGTFELLRHILNQYTEMQMADLGRIPQFSKVKLFLPDGQLEMKHKLKTTPKRKIRRRVRMAKPKSSDNPLNQPDSSQKDNPRRSSRKAGNSSSTVASQGMLQDLSIKDMGSLPKVEKVDVGEHFESLDDDFDDEVPSEGEYEEETDDEDDPEFQDESEDEDEENENNILKKEDVVESQPL